MFALMATVRTTTQYIPVQLIFVRDSTINQCDDVDWGIIKKQKQNLTNKGNKSENRHKIKRTYKQGDKVFKTRGRQNSIKMPT